MIQLQTTRLIHTGMEKMSSGLQISEEGMPLSFAKENGETVVIAGVANAPFAGLSMARSYPPALLPRVIEGVVPAAGVIDIDRAPVAGQLFASVDGVAAAALNDAGTAGNIAVVGTQVQFNAADVGSAYFIQFMYAPTVEEARQVMGDAPYGGQAANIVGEVCAIKQGQVGTTFFDASKDWSNTLYAKLAGGKFVPAGANDGLANVVVKNSPNQANPFLVVDINLA